MDVRKRLEHTYAVVEYPDAGLTHRWRMPIESLEVGYTGLHTPFAAIRISQILLALGSTESAGLATAHPSNRLGLRSVITKSRTDCILLYFWADFWRVEGRQTVIGPHCLQLDAKDLVPWPYVTRPRIFPSSKGDQPLPRLRSPNRRATRNTSPINTKYTPLNRRPPYY